MAKNKLSDLSDHLFMALERLNDESLPEEKLEIETKRAEAIIGISNQIIGNAKVTIDAMKLISSGSLTAAELPESFGIQVGNTTKQIDRPPAEYSNTGNISTTKKYSE